MRRLILLVMVVLLPLRAAAGDAMAIHMAKSSGFGQVVAVSKTIELAEALPQAHSECPGHSAEQVEATPAEPKQSPCSSCVTCQICHNVAISDVTPTTVGHAAANGLPTIGTPLFTSAARALNQKPPIS